METVHDAAAGPECLVMAKPIGAACNLRCAYCYYLAKGSLFPEGPRRMPDELLESYIRQRLAGSPGPATHFEWHGGEPTLLGLDRFRSIVAMQRAHRPPGRTVTNGLQTNGMLVDEAWADFLRQEGFSVGLSLDGPARWHDAYRVTVDGSATHGRVVQAFHLLRERGVFTNVLCVLHAGNVSEPDAVYDFFRGLGVTHLQFLPLVIPAGGTGAGAASGTGRSPVGAAADAGLRAVAPPTASGQAIGAFLCRVFDRWIREDVGKIVIQTFDEALRPLYGAPHALCVHRRTCGEAAVLEHDGGFYACDHFVDPAHLIGNLRERPLAALAGDPRMAAFGRAKRDALPRACRACAVLPSCNGGCPKDRILETADGEPGLNYLCPAYTAFFTHARPELSRLAAHMKAGGRLRAFKPL